MFTCIAEEEQNQLHHQVEQLRVVQETDFQGWRVKCFHGPKLGSTDTLGFTATATTKDINKAAAPRASEMVTRISAGNTATLVLVSNSKSRITRELLAIFNGFSW